MRDLSRPELPATGFADRRHCAERGMSARVRAWGVEVAGVDRVWMLRAGDVIWLCALGLLLMGVVMVRSAGLTIEGEAASLAAMDVVLSRTALYAGMALIALFVAARAPVQRFVTGEADAARSAWFGVVLAGVTLLLCLLVYAPGVGRQVNGAHRWLGVRAGGAGMIGFQPSEIAKWASVLLVAWWVGKVGAGRMRSFTRGFAPVILAVGALSAIIAVEDLGTAALIALAASATLLAAGARLRHFVALSPLALAGLATAIIAEPYRVRRLTAFLDPFADPQGAGYHMIQSMAAIASGGVAGRGLGFGLQKFGYLPEDTTDFLFAIIAEELGFVGTLVVVTLYSGILWSGVSIVRRESSPAMRALAVGVLATIAIQATINIAAVTGLGPTKGIALPLLSAGGTGWIMTAAALGVLVGMDRRACEREITAPTTQAFEHA